MSGFRSNLPTTEDALVQRKHIAAMSKVTQELKEEKEISQALRWDIDRLKSEEKRGREREERLVLQVVHLRSTIRDLEEELNVATEGERKARATVKKEERDLEAMSEILKQEQSDIRKILDAKRQAETDRDLAIRRAERAEEELQGLRRRRERERKEMENVIRRQMDSGQRDSQVSASKQAALLQQLQVLLEEQDCMRKELEDTRRTQNWSVEKPDINGKEVPTYLRMSGEAKHFPKGGLFSELFRGIFPWGEDRQIMRYGTPSASLRQSSAPANGTANDEDGKYITLPDGFGDLTLENNAPTRSRKWEPRERPLKSVLDQLADGNRSLLYSNDPATLETLFWQVVAEAREAKNTVRLLLLEVQDLREALQREKERRESRALEATEARKDLTARIEAVDTLRLQLDEKDTVIHSLERELSYTRSHLQAMSEGRDEEFRRSFSIRSQAAASLERTKDLENVMSSLAASHQAKKLEAVRRETEHNGMPRWR